MKETKVLLRFIGETELEALKQGKTIKPKGFPKGLTSLDKKVLFFLETTKETIPEDIKKYHDFLVGIADDHAIVIIETDNYLEGYGTYADLTSRDWNDIQYIKEYGVKSYKYEDVISFRTIKPAHYSEILKY